MKSKNILLTLTALLLTSCGTSTSQSTYTTNESSFEKPELTNLKIVTPSGTPALALANYFEDKIDKIEIVDSSTFPATFSAGEVDMIVAPVNVGVKFYNTNQKYLLYKTVVWGNLFIITRDETITDFKSLEGKTVTYFGSTSATPYIVTTALAKKNNINITLSQGAANVSDVNKMFVSGQIDTIITAEPTLSALKIQGVQYTSIIDLQEEYKSAYGYSSYPQAGVFIKKESYENYSSSFYDSIIEDVQLVNEDKDTTVTNAKKLSCFSTMNENVLKNAIPGSNIKVELDYQKEKESIDKYLDILSEQGLGKTYGEVKPEEEFYIH